MENSVKHINKGFLKNKELYIDTIKFWEKHVMNMLNDKKGEYQIWLSTNYSNGDLIMDGNPVFSLIKKDKIKALRIVQDEPRSNKRYMHVWTEVFDKDEGGDNMPVLVISLELSNKTLMESLNLIENWFVKYNRYKFKRLIDITNEKYKNNYVPSDKEAAWELHENLNDLNRPIQGSHSTHKALEESIKTLFSIRNSWENRYIGALTNINKDLGASIYTRVVALYELTNQMGSIKKYNTSRTLPNDMFYWSIRKKFSETEFLNIYSQFSTQIQELNEKLEKNLHLIEK
jgi:hypothetical protein